jgi:general secretion pathway protein L
MASTTSAMISAFVDDVAAAIEPMRRGRRKRAAITLVERGGGYEIYRNDRRGPTLLGSGELGDFGRKKFSREVRSQPVEVRLDGSRVLSKVLQLPAASRDYLEAIVTHQLERTTPWAADRVVFDYALAEGEAASKEHVAVRLVATSRDVFEATLARLSAAGIKPALIGTSEDPLDQPSAVNLLHTSRAERRKGLRRRVRAGLMALLVVGIGISAFAGWRLFAANAEAATLEQEMTTARASIEAAIARTQSSESYAELLERKNAVLPMVALLDQVSAIVPTSTYLTEFAVDGEELRLTGYSGEAPALIGILEAAELLADVRFAAATTREEGSTLDRFEVVARILPPAPGAQAAGPPAPQSDAPIAPDSEAVAPEPPADAAAPEPPEAAAPPAEPEPSDLSASPSFSDPGVVEQ